MTNGPAPAIAGGGTLGVGSARHPDARSQGVVDVTIWRGAALGAIALVLVAGCSGEGSGASSPSPTGSSSAVSATPALAPLELAQAALMDDAQLPVDPPGTDVAAGLGYSAQAEQVNAPWAQVLMCSTAQMSDEGAMQPEPGAVAGAWGFGRAGAAQVDQYAIVYADEAAAQAAVTRARAWIDDCDAWIATWAEPDLEYTVGTGDVPDGVEGFSASLTVARSTPENMVSSVMRSGSVVHYMRANEMPRVEVEPSDGATGEGDVVDSDGLLDDAYVQSLLEAAAASLTQATGG